MSRLLLSPIPCVMIPFVAVCLCCTALAACTVTIFQSRGTPTPTVEISRPVQVSTETLADLEQTIVPINDPLDLAGRLKNLHDISPTVPPPAAPFQVGDRQTFWVSNQDTNKNFQVQAVLSGVTDHVYFWVQDGVSYNQGDLRALVETFENKIYPTDRQLFGSEWTPGVDGTVDKERFESKGRNTPFSGWKLKGGVAMTIVGGRVVYPFADQGPVHRP